MKEKTMEALKNNERLVQHSGRGLWVPPTLQALQFDRTRGGTTGRLFEDSGGLASG